MNMKHLKARIASPEEAEEMKKEFSDIGPFTITITNPDDLLFLHTACLIHTLNGDVDHAKEVLLLMADAATQLGPEKAIDMAVKEGREYDFYFPDFYKPLAIAMIKHTINKAIKKED